MGMDDGKNDLEYDTKLSIPAMRKLFRIGPLELRHHDSTNNTTHTKLYDT